MLQYPLQKEKDGKRKYKLVYTLHARYRKNFLLKIWHKLRYSFTIKPELIKNYWSRYFFLLFCPHFTQSRWLQILSLRQGSLKVSKGTKGTLFHSILAFVLFHQFISCHWYSWLLHFFQAVEGLLYLGHVWKALLKFVFLRNSKR